MTGLSRARGPSYDAESISSSITGSCPSAPAPFKYPTASSEVTCYQHPSFRSLELLLPAPLWSDAFVQERARYTLLPRHLFPFSSPSAGVIREPSSSYALDPASRTTATTAAALEEPRRASSADVGGRLSGRWSFMAIYRNFKRAREATATREKVAEVPRRACLAESPVEDALLLECPRCALSPSIRYLPSPSMSLVDGCSVAEVDDGDDYGEVVNVRGNGLSSPCSCSTTTSRAESIGAAAWHPTTVAVASEMGTKYAMVRECQMTRSASSVTAAVAATSLNAAHAEALRMFETVLDRVSVARETRCPLCSPPRPPPWGRCAQPASLNGPLPALAPTARAGDAAPIYPEKSRVVASDLLDAHELSLDAEKQAGMEAHRLRLLRRARSLLNRHGDRLRYLSETKPSLFRETVQSHPLARACAQLGGLPLLRALSATL
ncbi:conserved hypothetical protein [Leishmania infantum JPCM5]|uniref:Uncharacterized protein n=1 Tax=Leishmania infantum TaxID=5671 RepID=A4HWI0_LEIIN|nr:conserved hypothetical protein [Leishmania infantum JPCM5]CAM66808.1 conserved hypothetical protein [Leishmania infantum JPCM5]|eukprot:XP_001464421.1 conserved hypothetical protein [Leishmania infantum JPCM5]